MYGCPNMHVFMYSSIYFIRKLTNFIYTYESSFLFKKSYSRVHDKKEHNYGLNYHVTLRIRTQALIRIIIFHYVGYRT